MENESLREELNKVYIKIGECSPHKPEFDELILRAHELEKLLTPPTETYSYSCITKECYDCGGSMTWCESCRMWSRSCCVDWGTCMCS